MTSWVPESTKIARSPGLRPGLHCGSLQRSPIIPSWWGGGISPPQEPRPLSALRSSRLRPEVPPFGPHPGVPPQIFKQIYATALVHCRYIDGQSGNIQLNCSVSRTSAYQSAFGYSDGFLPISHLELSYQWIIMKAENVLGTAYNF